MTHEHQNGFSKEIYETVDISARLDAIERQIDPGGILPTVRLAEDDGSSMFLIRDAKRFVAFIDDKGIGEIQLRESEADSGVLEVVLSAVDSQHANDAGALYLAATKMAFWNGLSLANNPKGESKPDSELWQWFASQHVAVELQPYTLMPDGNHIGRYMISPYLTSPFSAS